MKIGFVGSISVGKTSIVNELKKLPQFSDYEFITERSKYLRDLGISLNSDSTINGQLVFAAERALELMKENVITDRTIIDVQAFTSLAKNITREQKDDFIRATSHLVNQYDYIFYVDPTGVKLEDNGVRCIDADYRDQLNEEIRSIIVSHFPRIQKGGTISGTMEERIEQILNFLKS